MGKSKSNFKKKFLIEIKDLKIGEYTKPINTAGGLILLFLNNKKKIVQKINQRRRNKKNNFFGKK